MSRILIIEDEADLRTTLAEAIETAGYEVMAIETAEKGLAEHIAHSFDLIVLDVMTHSLHGAAFMQRLSMLPPEKQECKVIVLTALDNQITKDKMRAHPIAEFLVKSETPIATLLEKIKFHLSQS